MASTPKEVIVEEVEHLMSFGDRPAQVANRLGIKPNTIARALYRAGRPDIASAFERVHARPTHPCEDCGAPARWGPRCRPCGHTQRIKTRYGNTTKENP